MIQVLDCERPIVGNARTVGKPPGTKFEGPSVLLRLSIVEDDDFKFFTINTPWR